MAAEDHRVHREQAGRQVLRDFQVHSAPVLLLLEWCRWFDKQIINCEVNNAS